ncbi:dihydrodipicolinate reductase [Proteus mirabilis]|uniref:4-hydroxy-tetrahydrodipicolinate reductase n=1 Tax=Proteus mirabilis TaxID=584 RepID=A0A379FJ43_PROMI|nr:dihydrodipicolinate reductase [Proteus mirabilis]
MSATELRLAVVGAGGRMGRQLIQAINQQQGVVLGAAFERTNSSLIGADAGELAGIGHIGITVTDNLLAQVGQFDILIDFTRPEGTLSHLAFCVEHHKGMIIGTTGFDEEGKKPLIVLHKLFLLSLLLTLVLALI